MLGLQNGNLITQYHTHVHLVNDKQRSIVILTLLLPILLFCVLLAMLSKKNPQHALY